MTGINQYVKMEEDYIPSRMDWGNLEDSPEALYEITGMDRCLDCCEWCREDHECPYEVVDFVN